MLLSDKFVVFPFIYEQDCSAQVPNQKTVNINNKQKQLDTYFILWLNQLTVKR